MFRNEHLTQRDRTHKPYQRLHLAFRTFFREIFLCYFQKQLHFVKMGLGDGIGTSGLFSTRLLDFNWTELYTPFDNVRTQINGLAFPVVAKNRSDRYMFSGSNQSMLPQGIAFTFARLLLFVLKQRSSDTIPFSSSDASLFFSELLDNLHRDSTKL